MEELCTNVSVISSSDREVLDGVLFEITNHFEFYILLEEEPLNIELEFTNPGAFPLEKMREITAKYPGDSTLYMQVVTYNLKNEMVEHHIYKNRKWQNMIT